MGRPVEAARVRVRVLRAIIVGGVYHGPKAEVEISREDALAAGPGSVEILDAAGPKDRSPEPSGPATARQSGTPADKQARPTADK